MRNISWIILLLFPPCLELGAQTLFVPGGFSSLGVGTSSASGNVGIGTSVPEKNLHVDGGIVGSSVMIGNTTSLNRTSLWLNTEGESGKASIQSWWAGVNQGVLLLNPNGGNVGIGTTAPSQRIEVVGSGGSGGLKIRNANEIVDWGILMRQNDDLSGRLACQGQDFQIEAGWNKSLILGHPEFSTYGGKVVIPGGNVGIGTATPDAKLTVKGTIHAEEVRVDLSVPGPDYVFEKDYPLTSLEELKSYIDQNKHLPEIPSAKEMEENGINLKEMNLLLLKKVEELTLHTISQEEKIERLEKLVQKLIKER